MNKAFTYVLIFFILSNSITAQVQVDDLQFLWKIAIRNNPNQKVYALKREQLGYDYKTTESVYYPQAAASFNGQDNLIQSVTPVPGIIFNKPGTVYLQFGKHYTYNAGLTVTKNLFDWQAILQSKVAKENIQLNDVQQEAYIQTLKTQLGQYYYTALIAKSSSTIAEKDLALADSIYEVIKDKFNQGLTDASAVNQAQINRNSISQNSLQSEQLYNQAIANIKILSGIPVTSTLILKKPVFDRKSIAESLGNDKTLAPYSINIAIADLQRKAQKAALLPKLTATGYFGFQQFQNELEMSFARNAWSDYQYIGLGLNWPLFTGFANTNKLKSITTQKKIAEQNYQSAKEQSDINDSLLFSNYNSYSNMTATAESSFNLYGKNLELSLQKFREGLISIDAYLKTFQDYLAAENVYLNNLSNLLTTKAAIEARAPNP